MKPISVVIIAKDESANIQRCIESCVKVSDDIIVMDTGSHDDTIKISKSLGARVFESDWLGYGKTKNKANQLAKHNWILSIDADEALSETLINTINATDFEANTIYKLNRITSIGKQWVNHSGWHPQFLPRIFEKQKIQWNNAAVHEQLIIPGSFSKARMNGLLLHYSFANITDLDKRLTHYAKLKAKEWIKSKNGISAIKMLFGPMARFLATYFIKLGFLDGKTGFLIAKKEAIMIRKAIIQYKKMRHD